MKSSPGTRTHFHREDAACCHHQTSQAPDSSRTRATTKDHLSGRCARTESRRATRMTGPARQSAREPIREGHGPSRDDHNHLPRLVASQQTRENPCTDRQRRPSAAVQRYGPLTPRTVRLHPQAGLTSAKGGTVFALSKNTRETSSRRVSGYLRHLMVPTHPLRARRQPGLNLSGTPVASAVFQPDPPDRYGPRTVLRWHLLLGRLPPYLPTRPLAEGGTLPPVNHPTQ